MSQQQKNFLFGGGSVVVLAAAAYLYFSRANAQPNFAREHVERTVDVKTGEEFTIKAPNGEAAPYANPKTGERTLYTWYYCADCGKRVIPQLAHENGVWRVPMAPSCPICKGGTVTPWAPEFPEQAQPKKPDGPLPKL